MDTLNPLLEFINRFETSYRKLSDLRSALTESIDLKRPNDFEVELVRLLGGARRAQDSKTLGFYSRTLLSIFRDGLSGDSVLERLQELQRDLERQTEIDIQAHIERLPMIMLVPLLLLQLPAFLLLLLGPLVNRFLEGMQ